MTYPRLIVDAQRGGYKLRAWPHGVFQHGPNKGTWSWCVELTRPGDSKPANIVGRNRPGWPEFYHRDDAFSAAEAVLTWAWEYEMTDLLPVPRGLRFLHRLAEHLESMEKSRHTASAALDLLAAGREDEAWALAQQDTGLLPGVTRAAWLAASLLALRNRESVR